MLKTEAAQHFVASSTKKFKKIRKTVCNCAIYKRSIGPFEGAKRVEISSDMWAEEAEPDHSIHRPITLLISVPAGNTRYGVRL